LVGVMWRQLRGRVSQLFLVDNESGRVLTYYPDNSAGLAGQITKEQLEWFRTLKETSMSHLQKSPDGNTLGDYHLIAVPAMGMPQGSRAAEIRTGMATTNPAPRPLDLRPRTVVAIIPIRSVRERFFDQLNKRGVVNASLLDDSGTILESINPKVVGLNAMADLSPTLQAKMGPLITGEESGTRVIDQSYELGGQRFDPRIMAFEPIKQLPGHKWAVLMSSPLSDAELPVKDLFREAMLWAVFVSLSVTGILGSTSFFMIRSRVRYERARHDSLKREMEQARQIQLAWLPDNQNTLAGLEVSAANLPASHISGDFYNWFHLPALAYSKRTAEPHESAGGGEQLESSKVAIVIGDVTGHGMAAAFLMATTQLLVRTTLSHYQDPGRCLKEVNRQLCMQGFRGQFVTMLVIVLDPRTSSIEVATAGHPAPLVERDGKFVSLEMEPQLVLGVDPQEQYKTQGFILEPGASVMLYTDGVVEAEGKSGEQYGVERLIAELNAVQASADPQARIHAVLEDVKRFCANKDLLDDVTLVAVRTAAATVEVSAEIGM
jgi:serine phosphatase RsbU (regulator of sigma subunit)